MEKLIICAFVLVISLLVQNTEAITDAHKAAIRSKLVAGGIACIKDHPLSMTEITAFRNKMLPDSEEAKCFAACLFKKVGIMDDMGNLSPTGALDNARNVLKGNEEHMKNVEEIIQKCSAVNDQKTSDGDKGCDRAKLVFTCLAENAPKYGFDMNFK